MRTGVLAGVAAGALSLAGIGAAVALSMAVFDWREEDPPPGSAVVQRVVDGDTLVLRGGGRVRLIGIDAPERGTCGAAAATRHLRRLVEGQRVDLVDPVSVRDEDRYERLLRYVEEDGVDAGLSLLRAGLAEARYDSRDGYDRHPRENRYRRTAAAIVSECERRAGTDR